MENISKRLINKYIGKSFRIDSLDTGTVEFVRFEGFNLEYPNTLYGKHIGIHRGEDGSGDAWFDAIYYTINELLEASKYKVTPVHDYMYSAFEYIEDCIKQFNKNFKYLEQ